MKLFKYKYSSVIPNPTITLKYFHDIIKTRFPWVKERKGYISVQTYHSRLAPHSP